MPRCFVTACKRGYDLPGSGISFVRLAMVHAFKCGSVLFHGMASSLLVAAYVLRLDKQLTSLFLCRVRPPFPRQ
ncbi:hypothetical protein HPB52_011550 [Rhipicephalus sanguineus]|uniref:Uncharacterized protein n=1 Tax=Rhipicephalus sanguineus TaxID=34632 RepID=A0A9D4PZN6_RHISA|nr:hypothetical protein HPB52_011550 [Rhipicephalus sanguineus]